MQVSLLAKLTLDTLLKNKNEVDGRNNNSAEPPKAEKEEGELSPVGEFEENFMDFKEDNVKSMLESEHEQENQSTNGNGGGGNGAEADDEDSENNVSDRGGEISGSDVCSHEEENEEEEEEVDHNEAETKAGSEDEHDAHGGTEDWILLPLPERFLSSAKPLLKRIQGDQLDDRKDPSRIFYANDDFYVLFRLHQVRNGVGTIFIHGFLFMCSGFN